MGAVTVSVKKVGSLGNLKCMIADVTMNASYTTGGDAASPALFGMNEVLWANFDTMPVGIKLDYIKVSPQSGPTTLNTVKAWYTTGGATVPTSVSAVPTITSGATGLTGSAATLANLTA